MTDDPKPHICELLYAVSAFHGKLTAMTLHIKDSTSFHRKARIEFRARLEELGIADKFDWEVI